MPTGIIRKNLPLARRIELIERRLKNYGNKHLRTSVKEMENYYNVEVDSSDEVEIILKELSIAGLTISRTDSEENFIYLS